MQPQLFRPDNAEFWLNDLLERLDAHFERVVDYFDEADIAWEDPQESGTWTLERLRDEAPAWCYEGFADLGWPDRIPLLPALRGYAFPAKELALERIHPDFLELYHLSGSSPAERLEADGADEDTLPFPMEP